VAVKVAREGSGGRLTPFIGIISVSLMPEDGPGSNRRRTFTKEEVGVDQPQPTYGVGEYLKISFRLDGPELPPEAVVSLTYQTIPPTTYAPTTLREGTITLSGTRDDVEDGHITVRGQVTIEWPLDPAMSQNFALIRGQIDSVPHSWGPVPLDLDNLKSQLEGRWPESYTPPGHPPPPSPPAPPPLPHVPPKH
jgi:hypothetical protein